MKAARIAIGIVLSIFIVGLLVYVNSGVQTNVQAGLLSIFLTLFSIIATWVFSHVYAEMSLESALRNANDSYRENLRTFALKAAEKVKNLSNEIVRLSNFIQEELDDSDFSSVDARLQSRESRMESVIHLAMTLKNSNDMSLSDWKGVIGEELEKQEQIEEERFAAIDEIVYKIEKLEQAQAGFVKAGSPQVDLNDISRLRDEIGDIKRMIRSTAADFGAGVGRFRPIKKKFDDVEEFCSQCGSLIRFRQRHSVDIKAVKCPNCKAQYLSRRSSGGRYAIIARKKISEEILCPDCQGKIAVDLDNCPGVASEIVCSCGKSLRVVRRRDGVGIDIHVIENGKSVTLIGDDVVQQVRMLLPAQPWPKDTHRDIAEKLGIEPKIVSRAIRRLIDEGAYYEQVDGKILGK